MRILYIEDNEDDVGLVKEFLPSSEFDVVSASNAAKARERLEEFAFDAVLLDHGLPDTNSLIFLDELRVRFPALPVIVLTGRDDEALAVSVLQKGAACHLNKNEMAAKLCTSIREVVARRTGAKRISDCAEHLSRILLSMMNEGCLLVDVDGVVTFANEAAEGIFGSGKNELLGRPAAELFDHETSRKFGGFLKSQEKYEGRLKTEKEVFISWRALDNRLGPHEACLIVIADISELIAMRDALKQRLGEVERFQRFFIEREHRIIDLKVKIREYEKRLGIRSTGLSEETHREIDRRLAMI